MISILIIVAIFIFSVLLIHTNLKASLVVLLVLSVLLHKELFSIYTWDVMPVRVFMLALAAYSCVKVLVYVVKHKSLALRSLLANIKDPFIFSLLILTIVNGISIVNTLNVKASLSLYAFFVTVVVLGVVLYKTYQNKPDELISFIKKYTFIAFLLSLFGFFQLFLFEKYQIVIGAFWNIPNNTPRVGSLFWDVNHFGAFLAALLPVIGVFILIEKKKLHKAFYVFTAIPMVALLFLTSSRSAWILAAISFLIFAALLFVRAFKYKGLITLLLIVLTISGLIFREYSIKSSPFRAKVKQYLQYRTDSFDSHFLLLTGAGQVFEQYPIFGGGYGGFFEHFSKTKVAPTYFGRDPAALNTRVPAHTIWGETLSDTGIVGLTALLMFLGVGLSVLLYVALTFKDKKHVLLASAMFASVVGWLFAGIFYSYNSEFFWIIIFSYFIYGFALIRPKISFSKVFSYFLQSRPFPLIVIVVIAAGLLFVNLGTNHLIPWDEAIYAKIAKNMVQSGDYTNLQWAQGTHWFEKPPLYMWAASVFINVLGPNSLAPRLPSAIFGLLTIIAVYIFAKKLFNTTTAFLSALVLATTFQFLYYARASMLDVTTAFFITATLLFYFFGRKSSKNIFWLLAGVFCGLGIMTKDIVGLLPLPIIGLYELYLFFVDKAQRKKSLVLNYVSLAIAMLVVALPWHIAMLQAYGVEFYNSYIKYHVLDRALTDLENKSAPFYWYLIVMKVSMRLWFIALLGAFPFTVLMTGLFSKLTNHIKILTSSLKHKNNYVFLLIWSLVIFVFFSVSNSKLVWYIIPIYPVLAIIVGNFIRHVLDFALRKFSALKVLFIRSALLYLIVCTSLLYLLFNKGLVYMSDLTGPESRTLQMKDQLFGLTTKVYIDRIEKPLILYYTDGPFKEVTSADFDTMFKDYKGADNIVFITKESRFLKLQAQYPNLISRYQDDSWVLGVFPGYVPPAPSVLPSLQ